MGEMPAATTYFDIESIQAIRKRLESDFRADPFSSKVYTFPQVSDWDSGEVREIPLETSRIFSICSSLRLKLGYCWRLLVKPTGMSQMFAVPLSVKTEPPTWSGQSHQLDLPQSLSSFMGAVDGDDTAESYLLASFLSRDIQEWCDSPNGPPGF